MSEKMKTAFPGLQQANGIRPEDMEIVQPNTGGNDGGSADAGNNNSAAAASGNSGNAGDSGNNGQQGDPDQQVAPQPPNAPSKEIDFDSLSDEDRNSFLAKLTKGKLKSLDELNEPPKPKTKEEIEAEAKEKKQNALNYALSKGKVKRDDYDRAIRESAKSDRELALAAFGAGLREDDPDISDEEVEVAFAATYHEDYKPEDSLYKIGQKEIKKLANAYRKENFAFLDNIEPEYDSFVSTQGRMKAFRGTVKKLASELPKEFSISVEHEDVDGQKQTFEYKFPVDEKLFSRVSTGFASDETFEWAEKLSKDGAINEKAIGQEMLTALRSSMQDSMLQEALKQHGRQVEERMIAIMGNKRNQGQMLNNGQQPASASAAKQNSYPALNEHYKGNK